MAEKDPKNYRLPVPGRRFVVAWIAVVLIAFLTTGALVLARDVRIEQQSDRIAAALAQGPRVLVTHVLMSRRTRTLALPASVHGYIETPIYAKIPGYLKVIKVDKGDRVKKGQLLAILTSPEIDKQVADARANYWLQKVTDDRNQRLLRAGVVSQQTADGSHALMRQALAQYQQLLAMQAYETIRAPFSGVVTARYVDPGALIPEVTTPSAGSTPIIAMATLRPIRVYTNVPQSAAPFIKDGDPAVVTVAAYPGRRFTGTITRHPEALTPVTRTMLVEVDLPNRKLALFPGMYATMTMTVNTPAGVPMVPDDSLIFANGKVHVPVVRNDHLHLAPVTLGYDNGIDVEILSGVSPTDIVAINVGQSAREGEVVRPVMRDPQ